MVNLQKRDSYFTDWKEREALAEPMIPLIGQLYRRKVVTTIYSRPIANRSVIGILKAHRFIRQFEGVELTPRETFPILAALSQLSLHPVTVDIGKLAYKYKAKAAGMKVEDFVKNEMAAVLNGHETEVRQPQDIVLYGFGRIGRILARLLIEETAGGDGLRLKAVVVRNRGDERDLVKRASLLRRDSVHGSFQGTITVDEEENAIIANGNMIYVIYADHPESIDYTQYGIRNAILIDNTGKWRDEPSLAKHLQAKGVQRVLLTAPGKGKIKNIVHGVNHQMITAEDKVLSAASCTTNAIVPVLKAINDEFTVVHGHVETVHSYTNDQNLIDNYHKGNRRGRSAPLNMVLTSTGAAEAVVKALPELAGKLTGNAIRVPTPNVSMAILNLNLGRATTVQELNNYLRQTSLYSPLQSQIDFMNSPEVVSSDFVGSRFASVVDAEATIVNGDRCVVYVWYDNEFGYSCQVMRIVGQLAGLNYPVFPKEV